MNIQKISENLSDFLVLMGDDNFKSWLSRPHEKLGNRSPLWLMRHSRGGEVLALFNKEPEEKSVAVKKEQMYVVRLFDGFDNEWMDITKNPVTKAEAERIWNDRTNNGTKLTCYNDIDYYKIDTA